MTKEILCSDCSNKSNLVELEDGSIVCSACNHIRTKRAEELDKKQKALERMKKELLEIEKEEKEREEKERLEKEKQKEIERKKLEFEKLKKELDEPMYTPLSKKEEKEEKIEPKILPSIHPLVEKENKYVERLEKDPILDKHNKIIVDSSTFTFYKVLGIIFVFVLIFVAITWLYLALKDGSMINPVNLVCGNVTLVESQCPSLPSIPACPTCNVADCNVNLSCAPVIRVFTNGTTG